MRRLKGKYSFIILVSLIFVLLSLSIVYATLSTSFTITTSDAKINPWYVHFVNSTPGISTYNATTSNSITLTTTTKPNDTFKGTYVTFSAVGSAVKYSVRVSNDGKVKAKMDSYSTSVYPTSSNVSVALVNSSGSTLPTNSPGIEVSAGNYTTIYIKVWYSGSTLPSSDTTFNFSVTPKWIAST